MFNIRFSPNLLHMAGAACNSPEVDISETDTEFLFNFELPGALKDDIKIWLENDILTVSGDKKADAREQSESLVSERAFGKFERSFRLPESVDRNKVNARLVDGVLAINLPKIKQAKEILIN
jgi:HSP20 family protein